MEIRKINNVSVDHLTNTVAISGYNGKGKARKVIFILDDEDKKLLDKYLIALKPK